MALPDRRRALGIILVCGPRRPPAIPGQAARRYCDVAREDVAKSSLAEPFQACRKAMPVARG